MIMSTHTTEGKLGSTWIPFNMRFDLLLNASFVTLSACLVMHWLICDTKNCLVKPGFEAALYADATYNL